MNRSFSLQASTQEPAYQQRLEAIWDRLEYSEKDRMDMAVKYSAEGLRYKMDKVCSNWCPSWTVVNSTQPVYGHILLCPSVGQVLCVWEDACQGIDAREECLKNVEIFEENASNPNRFFAKGTSCHCYCSSSAITTPTHPLPFLCSAKQVWVALLRLGYRRLSNAHVC